MRHALVLSIALLLAACGSSSKTSKTETDTASTRSQTQASATTDGHGTCVAVFQRQRECTDIFIPALVDARVRADVPPGVAQTDAEGGREALVAQALEEWKIDSTDEAIETMCGRMEGKIDDAELAQASDCLAQDSCQAFTDCMIPLVEAHLRQ